MNPQVVPLAADYIRVLPEIVLSIFGMVIMVLDPLMDEEKSQKTLGAIGLAGAIVYVPVLLRFGLTGAAVFLPDPHLRNVATIAGAVWDGVESVLLDRATGDRPACLARLDGHMAVCNSLALKLAKKPLNFGST